MGASEEQKDEVSMEKYGCKFSELKDPQERQSVGGTIGGRMRAGDMVNRSADPADHGTGGASEEQKDAVSMEKYGCKFSELKDPQERQSVGGTIGGRMRQAAMTTKGGQEQEGEGAEAEAEGVDVDVGEGVEGQQHDLEEEDGGM
ncbi:hypothetical protein HYH02_009423 [Chlamydomonas schloesseri]|uniref:Uncharacterized protein n=1 Tax=Chlamydomonas schloesseri TaxID=2026947 RepID=A0A835W737_9CHLO|nr:hypothetical protein HYH02_009423 [Chlamydomonas schloesseri]|eukprot:KAG2443007.1 hypothetical protein HYH02_009423 [Chlamydomonas schloesseri]